MKIVAGNSWAHMADGTYADMQWLDNYLSVPVANAEFSEAFRTGRWDGRRRYMRAGRRFPAGFVRLVLGRAKQEGRAIELEDAREPFDRVLVDGSAGEWLRPHQRLALEACLARVRGLVVMPTGTGKTALFSALVQAVNVPWLVFTDTRDLLHQTAAQILKWTREPPGVIGDGEWSEGRVTVATFQTLGARLKDKDPRAVRLVQEARGLVVDETHILSGDEFSATVMACENAHYRIGVSATALDRGTEKDYSVIAPLGPVIHEERLAAAVEAGRLVQNEILMVRFAQPRATGAADVVYEAAVTLNQPRNDLIARLVLDSAFCPRPCLVFVKAIKHGAILQRQLSEAGLREVEYIHGQHDSVRRKAAVRRLEDGNSQVLIVSTIFNKGVDIPTVASAVNAAAGASVIGSIQKFGRGLRNAEGKDFFRYWDVYDEGACRMMRNHTQARVDAYRGRGVEPKIIGADDVATFSLRPGQ